jgi:hypothetical protein
MVSSSPAAISHMLTSSMLPPMPTFGSHEWFTRIITPSYSPGASAARKRSTAIGERGIPKGLRQARDGGTVCDMAALDRDHLPARERPDGMHAPAFDGARAALDRFRGNPRPDQKGTVINSRRHATILVQPGRAASSTRPLCPRPGWPGDA